MRGRNSGRGYIATKRMQTPRNLALVEAALGPHHVEPFGWSRRLRAEPRTTPTRTVAIAEGAMPLLA